jgi:DNA-binding transcriptional LysR family regulator
MLRRIPSTQALLAFDATARHCSIARAAAELILTESAVSRQISQLEAQLGVTLFHRVKKRLSLTRAGRAYAHDVKDTLERFERATFAVRADERAGATLEIATLPTVGSLWLIPRMSDFYLKHPQLQVNVSARSQRFLFSETHLDGALCFGGNAWPGAQCDYLFEETLVLVCSPQLMPPRFAVRELLKQRLLHLMTRPGAWPAWAAAVGQDSAGDNLLKGPRYEQQSMLISAARAGQGLALVPTFLVEDLLAAGELRQVSEVRIRSTGAYYFAFPDDKADEPHLKRFRTWLQEHARQFREHADTQDEVAPA